jgi:hypothetical protein
MKWALGMLLVGTLSAGDEARAADAAVLFLGVALLFSRRRVPTDARR